jgi:hypothetical protein
MPQSFLLSRVLLCFANKSDELLNHLSAVALTPEGNLWVGSDELLTVERLSPVAPFTFGEHKSFSVREYVELFDQKAEIDIEGMDYDNHYLWFTGSHSTKRKRTKGDDPEKDIERLSTIEKEHNRYLLVRIPVFDGELVTSGSHPDDPDKHLTAGCLQKTGKRNILIDALKKDSHLGLFLSFPLPSKENGFDIEGLTVCGNRVFIGFRGPVLQGWAIILEIEVEEETSDILTLKKIGPDGKPYKKHFVDLNGLGVRDLCLDGEDMIILAGPTMTLDGVLRIFRIKGILDRSGKSMYEQGSKELQVSFDLPFTFGADRAEGIAIFPCLGQEDALLVVYDAPDETRKPEPNTVFADVFQLK